MCLHVAYTVASLNTEPHEAGQIKVAAGMFCNSPESHHNSDGVEDTEGEQERTRRAMEGGSSRKKKKKKLTYLCLNVCVCGCMLPLCSKPWLGVIRVGVVESRMIGFVEVGVGRTIVMTDTSTDRQGIWEWDNKHTYMETNTCSTVFTQGMAGF